MAHMFMRNTVSDYASWRVGFDARKQAHRDGGVKAITVYQSVDDSNEVTICAEFESVEAAKAFASSDDLKNAMEKAGVTDVTSWFVNET